jgi:uncharacterized protein (TIGR03086 family)
MDLPALLDQAVASTGKIVAGVRPDQLGDPTPCAEWDVRELLNHVIGVSDAFSRAAAGEPIKPPAPRTDYFRGDGYAAAYEAATAAMLATWHAPGALDATITLPFGDAPGSVAASINFVDVLVHGWDLARATGQDATLDPDLAEPALEVSRNLVSDQFRSAGAFGPEVAAPADASTANRLVAFLGRTP